MIVHRETVTIMAQWDRNLSLGKHSGDDARPAASARFNGAET